jgi:hypothetical protein
MTMDDYIKRMVPNHEIDEYDMVHCNFDELTDITKSYIKKVTGRDAFIHFNYLNIDICFSSEEDLYTRPEKVHTIDYLNLLLKNY